MHGMQLPGLQGTSLKHSPGRHFSTNKGPENFTISVRKGKLQQPHKQQPVTAEAHAQGKAWRSSTGFRSWSFTPQQGQLWAALDTRAKATARPQPLPSLLTLPQHCHLLWQDLQEASRENQPRTLLQNTRFKGKLCLISSFGRWSLWFPPMCEIVGGQHSVSDGKETTLTAQPLH